MSMLLPHSDMEHMNTTKSEEQLSNSENGTIQGALECSMKSVDYLEEMVHGCSQQGLLVILRNRVMISAKTHGC